MVEEEEKEEVVVVVWTCDMRYNTIWKKTKKTCSFDNNYCKQNKGYYLNVAKQFFTSFPADKRHIHEHEIKQNYAGKSIDSPMYWTTLLPLPLLPCFRFC